LRLESDFFKGLQNLWSFDNSLKDSVGRCDLAIPTNVAPSADRFNNANSAYYFNNGYATAPPGVYFDPSTGGASIMAWFKAVSINNHQRVMDFGIGTSQNIFLSNYGTNPTISLFISPSNFRLNSLSEVSVNVWVHLTATFTTTSTNVYFNGIFDATRTGIISKKNKCLIEI